MVNPVKFIKLDTEAIMMRFLSISIPGRILVYHIVLRFHIFHWLHVCIKDDFTIDGNWRVYYEIVSTGFDLVICRSACDACMYHIIAEHYGLETAGYGGTVWIGATDEEVEGSFMWMPSQTPVIFDDWDLGEPNNGVSSGQDCAMYIHALKKWHDAPCLSSTKMFICEGWWHVVFHPSIRSITSWYMKPIA